MNTIQKADSDEASIKAIELKQGTPAALVQFNHDSLPVLQLTAAQQQSYFSELGHKLTDDNILPALAISLTNTYGNPNNGESCNQTLTKLDETSVTDILAKQPDLLKTISTDGVHINQALVSKAEQDVENSIAADGPSKTLTEALKGLQILDRGFAASTNPDAELNINTIAKDGFDDKQTFDDRLARDGNLAISSTNQALVTDYLSQNQGLMSTLESGGAEHFKSNLDALTNIVDQPQNAASLSPEFVDVVKMLHNSFTTFSSDGKSYTS